MRREFSKEFKRDAISLVIDQGYSRVDAARSLGIHNALLSRWVREHTEDGGDAFRGKGKLRFCRKIFRKRRTDLFWTILCCKLVELFKNSQVV